MTEPKPRAFKENMKLVKMAVRQIDTRKLPAMIDAHDLEQEGYIELQRCLSRFKDDGRARFSTYADKCIRYRIFKVIADAHWGPRHSEYHRRKQKGMELIKDMVSYEAFIPVTNDDEQDNWIDNVSEKDSVWEKLLDSFQAIRMDNKTRTKTLKSVETLLKKKPPSNNTNGYVGVVFSPNSERINKWACHYKIGQHRFRLEGFVDAEAAYQARQESLMQLKNKLLGID